MERYLPCVIEDCNQFHYGIFSFFFKFCFSSFDFVLLFVNLNNLLDEVGTNEKEIQLIYNFIN